MALALLRLRLKTQGRLKKSRRRRLRECLREKLEMIDAELFAVAVILGAIPVPENAALLARIKKSAPGCGIESILTEHTTTTTEPHVTCLRSLSRLLKNREF